MNPKRGRRTVNGTGERLAPLDAFVRRLEVLGATADEIESVRSSWDDLDDEWTEAERDAVRRAPDGQLRRMLDDLRAEHYEHTHDEEQEAEDDRRLRYALLLEDAGVKSEQAIPLVLEWVGDDRDRAEAMLAVEQGGQQRKGILEPMQAMLAPPAG